MILGDSSRTDIRRINPCGPGTQRWLATAVFLSEDEFQKHSVLLCDRVVGTSPTVALFIREARRPQSRSIDHITRTSGQADEWACVKVGGFFAYTGSVESP